MKPNSKKRIILLLLVGLGLLSLCGGCGLALAPIYSTMLGGALVGGIIGHQSGEATAGAVLGAAITGTGELLKQTDAMAQAKKNKQTKQQEFEQALAERVENNSPAATPPPENKNTVKAGSNDPDTVQLPPYP